MAPDVKVATGLPAAGCHDRCRCNSFCVMAGLCAVLGGVEVAQKDIDAADARPDAVDND